MLKQLLKMETPKEFFMETYEDHTNIKQKEYYYNLVTIIMNNGYVLAQEGVNPMTKKYFWKFLNKNTLPQLTEEQERQNNIFFSPRVKDETYWKRHDKEMDEMWIRMEPIKKKEH